MHTHPRNQRPLIIDALLTIALLATILLYTQAPAGAANVAGQPGDSQFTTGDLGVANAFVTSTTEVNTPDGKLAGVDGVQQYLESLEARYPEASFQVTDARTVNSMLIVDWHGTVDGQVVFPGRTLITIEDGTITDIWFLNLNNVAPVQGQMAMTPTVSAYTYYELPYEQGRPVVVEQDDATMAAQDAPEAAGRYVIVDEMGNVFTPEQAPFTVIGAAPESSATDADQDPN
jgi:hypothetical protein